VGDVNSTVEVVLILAGIPVTVTLLILLFSYVPDSIRSSRTRYRPGKPWVFDPMWLESSESARRRDEAALGSGTGARAVEGSGYLALPAGSALEVERAAAEDAPVPGPRLTRARTQRVSARSRGATATVVPELPGGARGTW
jgi:hypothetical protein